VPLAQEQLKAGVAYNFRVVSVDAAGNKTISENQVFRMRGYTAKVKIVDPTSRPVKGAKVTIADSFKTTDADGYAVFTDLPSGDQTISVEVKGTAITKSSANIAPEIKDGEPLTQSFEVRVGAQPSSSWTVPAVVGGLAVLLLAGGGAYWFFGMHGRPPRFGGSSFISTSGAGGSGGSGVVTGSGGDAIDRVPEPSLPSSGSVIDPQDGQKP